MTVLFENKIERHSFKKPKTVKRKIYFIFTKKNNVCEVFFISSSRIQNLTNDQYIKVESANRIDNENFMFGQSEVYITSDAHLIINRKNKRNRLQGTL